MEVKTNEPKRNRAIPLLAVLVCIALAVLLICKVLLPNKRYGEAQALYATGQYEAAMGAFEALNGYRDSAAQAEKCRKELAYAQAVALYEAGQYEGAIAAFTTLIGFRDSAAQIVAGQNALKDKDYSAAVALYDAGQYEAAAAAFTALIGHRDSAEWVEKCQYALRDRAYEAALALRTSGQYEEAIAAFTSLIGHRDSVEQIDLCKKDRAYDEAAALHASGQYEEAIAAFTALNGYRDSAAQIELCRKDIAYDEAVALQAAGWYETAIAAFEALNGHKDSAEHIEACRTAILDRAYAAAAALYAAGQYEQAIAAFEALDGYKDSAAQIEACRKEPAYDDAVALYRTGQHTEAMAAFEALDGFKDSAGYIELCKKLIAYGETAALSGQIIGIDATWDNLDLTYNNSPVAKYNLLLAYHVKRYLECRGATVVLSRANETTGGLSARERGFIFREASCTYVVRLMCNKHLNAKISACYVQASEENQGFAQNMIDAYVAATGMARQGNTEDGVRVRSDDVSASCGCPCVTIMLGNWDNETDRSNLQDEVFMDKICEGIFNGLVAQIAGESTETPEATTNSEYKTLKMGAVNDGDTVKKVQQRLVDLYYMPYPEKDSSGRGVVTATYGSMCAKAVTKFQERNGLKQTGQCDRDTYDRLMSDNAVVYSMKEKDKLDIVKTIQEALIQKGYMMGRATGYCSTDTVAAVKAFQKANGLTVTGQADAQTLRLLLGY